MNHRNFEIVLTVTETLRLPPNESAVLLLIAACSDARGVFDPPTVKPATLRRACRAVAGETGLPRAYVHTLWQAVVEYGVYDHEF